MLSRLIGDVYLWIIEISLWLTLLVSGVAGYHYAIPILSDVGLKVAEPVIGKILGALIFSLIGFLVSAVVYGPILLLADIRKSVRTIQASRYNASDSLTSTGRKDHFIWD